MVGTAVDIANHKLPIETIQEMFDKPENFYDNKSITILKPNGLYLKDVTYDPICFDFERIK